MRRAHAQPVERLELEHLQHEQVEGSQQEVGSFGGRHHLSSRGLDAQKALELNPRNAAAIRMLKYLANGSHPLNQ